jgi:hypothetical protein
MLSLDAVALNAQDIESRAAAGELPTAHQVAALGLAIEAASRQGV